MKPPEWLGKLAKHKWAELISSNPSLTELPDALALLCQSWDDYLTALSHLEEHGKVQQSGDRFFTNPNCAHKTEAWKQIVKLSSLFGLLPTPNTETEPTDLEV